MKKYGRLLLSVGCLIIIKPAVAATTEIPPARQPAPADNFLALPPSRICNSRDVIGVWQLLMIDENPDGAETARFSENPAQYSWFGADNTYGAYAGPNDLPEASIRQVIDRERKGLQQYLTNKGFVFFYQDKVAIGSWACFIVVSPQNLFKSGEMILMPPKGASTTRLVKVYIKRARVIDKVIKH